MNTDNTNENLMQTYGRLPVAFNRGEGSYLYDTQGRKYLDALTGLAVCGLGHAHPKVTAAVQKQAATLVHTSNLYIVPEQERLATRLCKISQMDRVFFGNSGAEANEAAIKLARLHGNQRGIKNSLIVVMEGSFHGRTMATLTATGNRKVHAGFEPLLSGFVRTPFGDVAALEAIADNNTDVVAVLVEPILGEGGIVIPPDGYLENIRKICDDNNWLLMLDEVQTGNGRTGEFFAYMHTNILPDVVTTAKGLANGFPIGACLARGEAANVLQPGNHGSTFGGNPLVCAAAHAVLDVLEEDDLIARADILGKRLLQGITAGLEGDNRIRDIRGMGLMLAIDMDSDCTELVRQALDKQLLINVTQEKTIRLLPPLTLSDSEADQLVDSLVKLISASA